ncbi:cytochrome ubiquinol oxidase subunit I [Vibrio genomosp. F10]|uniref:Cytochrome D ubiquinol oxidase subunit I n=2 Tax=Vibrio genomosp. F10 TaxID=723171 RepID=A0A1B9R0D0_9VIBR|nr:cytochrome ubiquinol oxidase subunit I [Vibrio genomosp. F10]OCH76786.1 cytochrome D ubiquinol oxidase subunit I [Vibrio genomosp. F10]OEE38349.1 cytochrome D ubiquinol oxidase subunit I [Vibrio genomosp. F10 str. ZF-129]OEE93675.1 cytochrome D ubiquinol oxidase subunit I [Vibrio genomosp. F10 str. 9ZC157]OEE98014.1 cytochrome D ubiquinol oxidase subunit I [Vibrio genomosp. F10 str. 9ZD137]OEF09070.1 cytochrome D ubiquinol oxidase subunit I [Vibrio genomosp. F10 str. 9ZB36]
MLDTLMLSRIQFATNISFHILFPTITIALAWMLVFFKWRYNRSQAPVWLDVYYFWVKIFALTFALGVVSGITMSFQFGTNWPGFMERVGNVAGPLLGYEVMTAFFMEATFLGVMLFGRGRVPDWFHTLATVLVAIGTSMSAFWILVLNSWMHTPSGYEVIDGIVHVTSWKEVILNPSLPYRLAHTLLASALTASFLIAGISAYQAIKQPGHRAAKLGLKVALFSAAGFIPLQIFVGDLHGLNTLEHQPAKIAAMEGVWETEQGAPLLLFAWPNEETRSNDFEVGIPNLASLILTHDMNGEIVGLNQFAPDHPPVKPLFFGFRVMVGMGVLMLLVSWYGALRLTRGKTLPKPYLYTMVAMTFSGWVATLAGWYVTEIGRQPWLVSGVLRTSEAVTTVPSSSVMISLFMYLTIYAVLLVAYIHTLFYLARKDIAAHEAPSKEQEVVS